MVPTLKPGGHHLWLAAGCIYLDWSSLFGPWDFKSRLTTCVDSVLEWVTCHSLKILVFRGSISWFSQKIRRSVHLLNHNAPLHKTSSRLFSKCCSCCEMCKRGYTHFSWRTWINTPGKLPLAWMWVALCQYKVINMERCHWHRTDTVVRYEVWLPWPALSVCCFSNAASKAHRSLQ